jgi:hypothetical protein
MRLWGPTHWELHSQAFQKQHLLGCNNTYREPCTLPTICFVRQVQRLVDLQACPRSNRLSQQVQLATEASSTAAGTHSSAVSRKLTP